MNFLGRCPRGLDTSLNEKVLKAIQNDDPPVLTQLLDVQCADANAVANNGYTALILGCKIVNSEMFETLKLANVKKF